MKINIFIVLFLIFLNINKSLSSTKYNFKNIILNIKNNNINNNYYINNLKKSNNNYFYKKKYIKKKIYFLNHFDYIKIRKLKNKKLLYILKYKPIIYKLCILGNKLFNKKKIIIFLNKFNIKYGKFFSYYNFIKFKKFLLKKYKNLGNFNVKISYLKNKLYNNKWFFIFKINEGINFKINNINIINNYNFSKDIILSFIYNKKYRNLFNSIFKYNFIYIDFINNLKNIKNFYLMNGYLDFKFNKIFINSYIKFNILNINIYIFEGNIYKICDIKVYTNIKKFNILINNYKKKIFNNCFYYKYNILKKIIFKIKKFFIIKGYININFKIIYKKILKNRIIPILNINLGNRYYIKNIIFKDKKYFKDNNLVNKLIIFKGNIYNPNLIKKKINNLNKNIFFKYIRVKKKIISFNRINLIYYIKKKNNSIINFSLGYGKKSNLNYNIVWSQKNIINNNDNFFIKGLKNKFINSINIFYNYFINKNKNIYIKHNFFYNHLLNDKYNNYGYLNLDYGIENIIDFYINNFLNYKFIFKYSYNYLYKVKSQLLALNYFNSMKKKYNINYLNNNIFNKDIFIINKIIIDKLNTDIFPVSGYKINLFSKFTLPYSNNNFYKFFISFSNYLPLDNKKNWIFFLNSYLGYGNGFNNKLLPFYDNFYFGDNIFFRGLNNENIGPNKLFLNSKNYKCNKSFIICLSKNSSGGNLILLNNFNIILSNYFFLNNFYSKYFRLSLFFDSGLILDTSMKDFFKKKYYKKLNYFSYKDMIKLSIGTSLNIITPIGLLNLSFGLPIKYNYFDEINYIQFNIGNIL